MGIRATIERWFGRAGNAASIWPLVPAGIVGVVMGYLSSGVAWINQFGAFGWFATGLLGFLIAAFALAGVGLAREKWALAQAARKWGREVDTVNPLAPSFDRKRIRLVDLAHPITSRIVGKQFTNCELLGKSDVVLTGGIVSGASFINCDFVVVRDDAILRNAIILDHCTVIGGELVSCTFYMKQEHFDDQFKVAGAMSLSYEKPDAP